jgi:hypothetical protein
MGVCPELVEIAPTGGFAAITIFGGAGGSEISRLGITGGTAGIASSGSENVTLDRVWVHDAGPLGVGVEADLGATAMTIKDSLIENVIESGVHVIGSNVTIENSVVRDTQMAFGAFGRGIDAEADLGTGKPSTVHVRRSLIERNHDVGLLAFGSDATVEGSVLRDTSPASALVGGSGFVAQYDPASTKPTPTVVVRGSFLSNNHDGALFGYASDVTIDTSVFRDTQPNGDGSFGHGVLVRAGDAGEASTLVMRSSLVELNHEVGVYADATHATLEGVLVRNQLPSGDNSYGVGILVQQPAATLDMRGSVVEGNRDTGIFVLSCAATIDTSAIRGTLPDADGRFGRGIAAQTYLTTGLPSTLVMRSTIVEQNGDVGLFVSSSHATVEQSIIVDMVGDPTGSGWAIAAQTEPAPGGPSTLVVRAARVERSLGIGIFVQNSEATIEGSVVSDTKPVADTFGDAIALLSEGADVSGHLTSTRVEQSGRSALAVFGGRLSYGGNDLSCQDFDLIAETRGERTFVVENRGENRCGCPEPTSKCLLESPGVGAPIPIDPSLPPQD